MMSAVIEPGVPGPKGNGNGASHAVVATLGDADDYITRMARDPQIDAAKLSALIDVRIRVREQERIEEAERRRIAFFAAFPAMQAEMPVVGRDTYNESTKSHFARLETIWEMCCPVWTRHGFSITFDVASLDNGLMHITLRLSMGGHTEIYTAPDTPPDTTGPKGTPNKTVVQGNQSSISYVKRGLLCNALGIVTRYEDDDGQSGTRPDPTRRDVRPQGWQAKANGQKPRDDRDRQDQAQWAERTFAVLDHTNDPERWMTVLGSALEAAPSATAALALSKMLVDTMEKAPRDFRNKVRLLFEDTLRRLAAPSDKPSDPAKPPSDKPLSPDEQWAEDVLSTLATIGDRAAFDRYTRSNEVQGKMRAFTTSNRALFERLNVAFMNKHEQLPAAGAA